MDPSNACYVYDHSPSDFTEASHVFQDLSDIVRRQAAMIEDLRDEKDREVKVSWNLFDPLFR